MSHLASIWIQTYTGKHLHPFNPKPAQMDIRDWAHALSGVVRWGGHCNPHYVVGEHQIEVAWLMPDPWKIYGLTHDGPEACGIGDMTSPVKKGYPNVKPFEQRLMTTFLEAYDIDTPPPDIRRLCKRADNLRALVEARDLMGGDVYRTILAAHPDLIADHNAAPEIAPAPQWSVKVRYLKLFWEYLGLHRAYQERRRKFALHAG